LVPKLLRFRNFAFSLALRLLGRAPTWACPNSETHGKLFFRENTSSVVVLFSSSSYTLIQGRLK